MDRTTAPSAPYSRRAPSPPSIDVPVRFFPRYGGVRPEFALVPTYEKTDRSQLSDQDFSIVTGNQLELVAPNNGSDWKYEHRREAQRILASVYLGPNVAIRDHSFLKREGITMILVIRNSSLATLNLLSLEKAAGALGITGRYFDVGSSQDLIHGFPEIIRIINHHLLSVHYSQTQRAVGLPQASPQPPQPTQGKVLLVCETGNDLSAAVAAAYIMSVYGADLASAMQFINVQRFCTTFDEVTKRLLLTWGDILRARASVARSQQDAPQAIAQTAAKRNLDSLRHGDNSDEADDTEMDGERFTGRHNFVPFKDLDVP